MKVEHYVFAILVAVLLCWGWYFTKRQLSKQENYSLYLVVKNQENCLEGIIRNLFRYLHKQETSLQLILLVEESHDQTLAIAQRLARSFSFEVLAISDLDQWIQSNSFTEERQKLLLDLRNKNTGWTEARKVRQFVASIKSYQEDKHEQNGLGS